MAFGHRSFLFGQQNRGTWELTDATHLYQAHVEQERQNGLSAGVSGTPGFIINGRVLTGNLPQDAFEKAIEAALAANKEKRKAP